MPAERLPMRKIREVLRLKYSCGTSDRVISRSVGIGRTAIAEYVRRAAVIGITWPLPEELDDTALERKLFAPAGRPLQHHIDRRAGERRAYALGERALVLRLGICSVPGKGNIGGNAGIEPDRCLRRRERAACAVDRRGIERRRRGI